MDTQESLARPTGRPWWREIELLLLVVLVAGIYFPRLTALTLRGEETRRAQVAAEILRSGDWIVPRQQGTTYLSRPPLGSWPIAALAWMRGRLDTLAVRLPTVTAVLLTTLLVYGYARLYLSRLGALAAAVAYPTMGQVLQIGRVAETEGLFTLLVAASLLAWHWGYLRGCRATLTWSLGYGLAAAAGLTKGPQGPVYFVAATWAFLVLRRDWRYLLSRAHLTGLGTFAVVLGAWQLPYFLATDWQSTIGIWTQQASQRFTQNEPWRIVRHVSGYPLEVLACMLPWSVFLVQLLSRRFRRAAADVQPQVVFLLVCLAATFPSVWLATGAKGRYYMPLYPVVAVLIGLVVERCWRADDGSSLRAGWQRFLVGTAAAALIGAIGVLVAGWIEHPMATEIAQPPLFAAVFLGCALALAVWLARTRASRNLRAAQASLLLVGSFLGIAYTGAVVNARVRVMQDVAGPVAGLKAQLPADTRLVSLGIVSHNFRYHFQDPIPVVPWPRSGSAGYEGVDYFCFDGPLPANTEVPWKWEKIAEVSVERNRTRHPDRHIVVIGRRVPTAVMAARDDAARQQR